MEGTTYSTLSSLEEGSSSLFSKFSIGIVLIVILVIGLLAYFFMGRDESNDPVADTTKKANESPTQQQTNTSTVNNDPIQISSSESATSDDDETW